MDKMKELRLCLLNDLRGIELEEHADLEGYIVRDHATKQALYTAYCAPVGFSSYIAINDLAKGITCADEKPLKLNASVHSAVSRIKTDHIQHGGPYPRWVPNNGFRGGCWKETWQ